MGYHVAIGGMKIRGWSVFFRVIRMTYAALKAARAADGCVHADIFRDGRRYFALSVWQSRDAMKTYARAGVHGDLMQSQSALLVDFVNHSYQSDRIPTRTEAKRLWREATGRV